MEEKKVFLSICIPSYNRPDELKRLLESIDIKHYIDEIEIIVCENHSPRRETSKKNVELYKKKHDYKIYYFENDSNYGYDKNLRLVASKANGEYVMFVSDDDQFLPNALDRYIYFVKCNNDICYILRRYQTVDDYGKIEEFRYSSHSIKFKAGEKAVIELYRRSVFLSGLTFKKQCFTDYNTDLFDGTLLFQLYIQSTICLHFPSCYCDIPLVRCNTGGTPYFGDSDREKELYSYGKNTIETSLNFLSQSQKLIKTFDKLNHTNISSCVIKSYSKYSYGFLKEHRDEGILDYVKYSFRLMQMGYGRTIYFYIYFIGVLFLGKTNCQKLIRIIKKIAGQTPHL